MGMDGLTLYFVPVDRLQLVEAFAHSATMNLFSFGL